MSEEEEDFDSLCNELESSSEIVKSSHENKEEEEKEEENDDDLLLINSFLQEEEEKEEEIDKEKSILISGNLMRSPPPPRPPPREESGGGIENSCSSTSYKTSKSSISQIIGSTSSSSTPTKNSLEPSSQKVHWTSTPISANNIQSGSKSTKRKLEDIKEEGCSHEELSLLYEDNDEYEDLIPQTISLSELAGGAPASIDLSILYDDDDDDENEDNNSQSHGTALKSHQDSEGGGGGGGFDKEGNLTVVEAKAADSTTTHDLTLKTDNDVKNKNEESKIKAKSYAQVRRVYYEKSCKIWRLSTPKGVEFPKIKDLPDPKIHLDPNKEGYMYGAEEVSEYADNFHPMWAYFREADEDNYMNQVHDQWGHSTSIDITRNLSRFGTKRVPKVQMTKDTIETVSTTCISSDFQLPHDRHELTIDNILDKIQDEKDENEEDRLLVWSKIKEEKEKGLSTNNVDGENLANSSEKKSSSSQLASCLYCKFICVCSPGRPAPRPYLGSHMTIPKKFSKVTKDEVAHEGVRTIIGLDRRRDPKTIMDSVEESFEFISHYADKSKAFLTQEQTRDLLSLESLQHAMNQHYKSPYSCSKNDRNNIQDNKKVKRESKNNKEKPLPSNSDNDNEFKWSSDMLENF